MNLRCRLDHCLTLACAIGMASMAATAAQAPERPWMNTSLSPDQRAELVLKAMTQDEKFRLIRSDFGEANNGRPMPVGALNSAGYVPAISRLGLPALQESDAGLGIARPDLNGKGATSLPSGLATAASFDPQLAYAGGAMIGGEARRRGFNVLLAGGLDLERDPRNGRNFEYAGEDPLLAGIIVGHAVQGVQSQQVIATVKHFALNALETGRHTLSAQIDPKAAHESDLLAFEIAIGIGHPGAVMCAYNRVNAVYACENDWLLNQVLKHDWAYPGFVMSDWGAVYSAGKAVLAGLDQESAGESFDQTVYFDKPLRAAVASGEVPQARIDDMVRRILRSMFAVGVIDHPSKQGSLDYAADGSVAQRAEEAGAVLLRNEDDLLPLSPRLASIAVIGGHADLGVLSGGGSSAVTPPDGNATNELPPPQEWPGPRFYQPSPPLAAISRRVHGKVQYNDGRDIAAAAQLAAHSDVAVVFVEQWSAESFDWPHMTVPDNQDALVAAVAKANPHTIVVLENNGPLSMPWLGQVGAVLEAWYPGARGGEAITRLLFGEVAPSGRLPMSWPRDESQLPRPQIPGAGFTPIGLMPQGQPADSVDYNIEGADVGYRWFQRRGIEPLFAFGYGLSYTHFGYDKLQVQWKSGRLVASFDVSNQGKRDGVDVPQLYVTLPGSGQVRRLAGWSRIALKAGETRHLEITADPRILANYDATTHLWLRSAGHYQLQLGHSSSSFEGNSSIELQAGQCATNACRMLP
ncbi:glycoside hydrolase family 3 protein [Dyella sp. S184]|uniref:beta-glucosidase family protein n=1 Tax=Dyella sp. S184 TaxID=1641862 RepID=UPI00131B8E77|nr:glycoside hydrolase family 3 protein [Dyella sp. S184]